MKKQIISLMVVASSLFAADLVTFTAGTPAKASEVNANFSELESRIAALQKQLNDCNCSTSNLFSEDFEGTLNSWTIEQAKDIPATIEILNGSLHIDRSGAGGRGEGAGISQIVNIPLTATTSITFDVNPIYRSVRSGCGDNCTEHPANIELTLEDSNSNEYKVRYAVNYSGAIEDKSTNNFKQYATSETQNTWTKKLKYTIKDSWANATKITKIYVFGAGWDFESKIDNIIIKN